MIDRRPRDRRGAARGSAGRVLVRASALAAGLALIALGAREALPVPKHARATATRASPRPAATDAEFLAELGPRFSLMRTEHFRIAHDTSREFARFHGRLFEAVYAAFRDFFTASGFDLSLPSGRLDAVLFEEREAFRAYAMAHGDSRDSSGFYSSASNRIAFFDAFDDPAYRKMRDSIDDSARSLRKARSEILERDSGDVVLSVPGQGQATYRRRQALRVLNGKEEELERQRAHIRSFYEDRDLSTTIHECIHQLAFNLGAHDLRADTPTWLAEGLATYFETMGFADTGASGLRNPQRYRRYVEDREHGRSIPLRELLTDDEAFRRGGERALTAYGQSWALVHYLLEREPEAFFDYLVRVVADRAAATERPARRLELFREVFGKDLWGFERGWHAHMRTLR